MRSGVVRLEGFPKCGSGAIKKVPVGCYGDKGRRALPKYFGSGYRGRSGADRCMAKAKSAGMTLFGVQYWQGGG
jgi:hypothetical protein